MEIYWKLPTLGVAIGVINGYDSRDDLDKLGLEPS